MKRTETQVKFFKKHLELVEPVEINLGDRTDMGLNRSSTSYKPQMRYETCQYISVIETLKSMLEKPEMQSIINN